MRKSKSMYWKLSAYFFFFFFTWSASYSLFSIWLGQEISLNGAETGVIFTVNAIFALCMQPLYGYISDKIGLKKHILFLISSLLLFVGPFYIFIYGSYFNTMYFSVPLQVDYTWVFLFGRDWSHRILCRESQPKI